MTTLTKYRVTRQLERLVSWKRTRRSKSVYARIGLLGMLVLQLTTGCREGSKLPYPFGPPSVPLMDSPESPKQDLPDSATSQGKYWNCGLLLLPPKGDRELLKKIHRTAEKYQVDERYLLAVVAVESNFNPRAHSKAEAYGLMQVTWGAVLESSASCSLPLPKGMVGLLDDVTNLLHGTCYLRDLYGTTGDWTEALVLYNGGIRQWQKYVVGTPVANETAQYVLRVERLAQKCVDH